MFDLVIHFSLPDLPFVSLTRKKQKKNNCFSDTRILFLNLRCLVESISKQEREEDVEECRMLVLPRDVMKWLQSMDLSVVCVRNVRRECSNGYVVAEIMSRYFPHNVSIHMFHNGTSLECKEKNWSVLKLEPFNRVNNERLKLVLSFCNFNEQIEGTYFSSVSFFKLSICSGKT